jgi:hypothetical protein
MPLDMRILESRDPDGRIAEAIKRGQKVNSSDYSALAKHSKKYLSPEDAAAEQDTRIYYAVQSRTTKDAPVVKIQKPKDKAQPRQEALSAKTAKRRQKRQRKRQTQE